MKNTNYETFNVDSFTQAPDSFVVQGRFSFQRNAAKCLEGKDTLWLFNNTATAADKKSAKELGVMIVENVSADFVDSIQKTYKEYRDFCQKYHNQCSAEVVFTRVRSTLTPCYTSVDYR